MRSTFVMVQSEPAKQPAENLKKAEGAIAEAVERYHPDCMIFPEMFSSNFLTGTPKETAYAAAQPINGEFVEGMRELAKRYRLWTVFGMRERAEDDGTCRCRNATLLLNDQGEIVQVYRKTHLYDAFGFRESDYIVPGDRLAEPADTPFGRIGLFVCYEVRFPEVARTLAAKGAEILIMPTAWVRGGLKSMQFRTLITARAIENTVFVLACDQCGGECIGESVAVDPMGVTVACGNEREDLIPVFVDTERIAEVRKKLPSFGDRRPELYTF